MKKVFIQGIAIVFLFLGIWYGLRKIDWIAVFKIEQINAKTEQKLGDVFWEVFKKSEKEIKNGHVVNSVDSIVKHICKANKIESDKLKIHIFDKADINAFALPNGHLILYSGLILHSDNQEELTGVICHEIAHIELNHVMKKLVKEIGLSVLISMTTGNSGSEVIRETAEMLSSSAFDRGLEKEADLKAVDYLANANVNPRPFADFLNKLSDAAHEATKYLTWISTHPDSKERARYIIEHSKGKSPEFRPILSKETWDKLKENLKE